jgi:hypothetical protein
MKEVFHRTAPGVVGGRWRRNFTGQRGVAGVARIALVHSRTRHKGGIAMDFGPLLETERSRLLAALRGNAEAGSAILMNRRDTGFLGTAEDVTDEEVITAIRSVPCHY